MTNSEGLDSKDEQFMLEQEPANKRTIREECGQSKWLKKLQSCLGQMTAAVPDMPCPQQLRGCSAYTLSLHITPHSRVEVWIQDSSERFTTSIILCSVVPDFIKFIRISGSAIFPSWNSCFFKSRVIILWVPFPKEEKLNHGWQKGLTVRFI